MKKLREIWNAYLEIDANLGERERGARTHEAVAGWSRLRNINDQAYFVMLFACFEDRVTALCRNLIERKQTAASWKQRRVWDTLDARRLDFMDFMRKVALLLDKRLADFGKVRSLYGIRCDIAHGAFDEVGAIDLASEHREIERLWKALRP